MGESVTEGTLARWTKQPGQAVKKDEVLVEIETDKVAVEVSAPADGVLTDVLVAEGATVKPGHRQGRTRDQGRCARRPRRRTDRAVARRHRACGDDRPGPAASARRARR